MKAKACVFLLTILAASGSAADPSKFSSPGDLEAGSGKGVSDPTLYFTQIRFPLERSPAYLNSQVYRKGGNHGPKGGQCDAENYSYPWRDNFCETRGWDMAVCPATKGHQGQDIRPATCKPDMHWAVAVEDGIIADIGAYSVTLQSPKGTLYRYLHLQMDDLAVRRLEPIRKGERIGKVSNHFGGAQTTIHLHFDIKDSVVYKGVRRSIFVPPYASLVDSYERLLAEQK